MEQEWFSLGIQYCCQALWLGPRKRLLDPAGPFWIDFCSIFVISHPRVLSGPATGLRARVLKNRANDRLLFGRSVVTYPLHEGGALHLVDAGQVFGFVRWRGDGYGTQTWRVVVARGLAAGEEGSAIPGLEPGGEVLLHAFGKARAKRALGAIDVLSDKHVLQEIAPAYWRHLHLCVDRNIILDPYEEAAFQRSRHAVPDECRLPCSRSVQGWR